MLSRYSSLTSELFISPKISTPIISIADPKTCHTTIDILISLAEPYVLPKENHVDLWLGDWQKNTCNLLQLDNIHHA